ncbi:LPXTG-domain-containing protein cell wall anchor domain [Enterococcus phoeniculicola]|nr:LPXTG-domain-containing protein cell wall anchor domain [Enterococcus phoeniculicola]
MSKMKKYLLASTLILLFPLTAIADTEVGSTTESLTVNSTEQSALVSENTENTDSEISTNVTEETSSEAIDASKEKESVQSKVEETIEKSETPDALTSDEDPSQIREALKADYMSTILSPEEVDSYTDQQLLNAMTFVNRVNYDVYSLDISGYAHALQALYKDHTLSWDKIEQAMTYNPNDFKNALDMIPTISQLQNYLDALYPSTSSFIAIPKLSDEELTNILTHISPIQKEIVEKDGTLFPGIIAWIMTFSEDQSVLAGGTATSTTSTTSSQESSSEVTSSSEKEKAEVPATSESTPTKKTGFLPKTGEQRKVWLTVIGGIILVIVLFILIRKKKNSAH